ncbi:MAG TPA: hypothetical protein VFC78_25280 [Tepidisphaeraceae bacterium]|nr:hypothetical protein [Tepidisphaeraceae bacterium]
MKSKSTGRESSFEGTDRLAAVLDGRHHSPGLDVISRCGSVWIDQGK